MCSFRLLYIGNDNVYMSVLRESTRLNGVISLRKILKLETRSVIGKWTSVPTRRTFFNYSPVSGALPLYVLVIRMGYHIKRVI